MKQSLLFFAIFCFFVSCKNQQNPYPSERITFDNTHLSFVTPDNWYRTNIPGSDHLTVFTEIHYDIKPNIQLDAFSETTKPDDSLAAFFNQKKSMYPSYTVKKEAAFITDRGLTGRKIMAQRENDKNISIIHIHYVFSRTHEMYILTGTCAKPGIGAYEEIFDQAMKSVEIRN